MTTQKKQFNVRLSDLAREKLRALGKMWGIREKTKTVEKMIEDTWKRETRK